MFDLAKIGEKFPSVIKPIHKLTLKEKLKWSFLILVLYFIMGSILVWGINPDAVARFEFFEIVFGSQMGSLITLGIGPIVTASIILQLLVGSKILNWDTNSKEGKEKFMGTQKILAISFCIIQAVAYVVSGAIPPASAGALMTLAIIVQLTIGGIIIIFMDEVVSKWGIGSGISLFIAAGVSKTMFIRIFSPPIGDSSGGIIASVIGSLTQAQPSLTLVSLLPLISTIVVFAIVVFAQSMKIEIPMAFSLPFGKFGSRRWPLKFIYTSNIPVILTAAVLANIQVFGKLLYSAGITFLGTYDQSGQPISGLMYYLIHPSSPSLLLITVLAGIVALGFSLIAYKYWKKYALRMAVVGGLIGIVLGILATIALNFPLVGSLDILRSIIYMIMMVIGAVIFSVFWVSTSGMDAHSVAEQFKAYSIMIPGFRHDPRIVERQESC